MMADYRDARLQGTDQAPASPAQTRDQAIDADKAESPEEVEWNRLSGSAQERFKKAWAKVHEKEVENEKLKSTMSSVPPPAPGSNLMNPEVQNAVRQLEGVGVATQDYVKNIISENTAQQRYEQEMQRLTSDFKGTRGEPQFVR